jgi:hypothetical protein
MDHTPLNFLSLLTLRLVGGACGVLYDDLTVTLWRLCPERHGAIGVTHGPQGHGCGPYCWCKGSKGQKGHHLTNGAHG